jgi:hypothetical protein
MKQLEGILSIHGAPRSGTTWLGRLLALHPEAVFRYQPFFAYEFKGRVEPNSGQKEIRRLLDEVFTTNNPFVLQSGEASLGEALAGPEKRKPRFMVMKSVRYHELILPLLNADPRAKIIGIVRHPCAVINSWLRTAREFQPGWSPLAEWRFAGSKNRGSSSEYWGFERWRRLTNDFLELEREHPNRFYLIQYEQLVANLRPNIERLFRWTGYPATQDVLEAAIKSQQSRNQAHDYGVRKHPGVAQRWRDELEPEIRKSIERELLGPQLSRFSWL